MTVWYAVFHPVYQSVYLQDYPGHVKSRKHCSYGTLPGTVWKWCNITETNV